MNKDGKVLALQTLAYQYEKFERIVGLLGWAANYFDDLAMSKPEGATFGNPVRIAIVRNTPKVAYINQGYELCRAICSLNSLCLRIPELRCPFLHRVYKYSDVKISDDIYNNEIISLIEDFVTTAEKAGITAFSVNF